MFDWNGTKPKLAMLGNMVDMLHRLARRTTDDLEFLQLRVDELSKQVSKIAGDRVPPKTQPDFVKLATKEKQTTTHGRKSTTKSGGKNNGVQR